MLHDDRGFFNEVVADLGGGAPGHQLFDSPRSRFGGVRPPRSLLDNEKLPDPRDLCADDRSDAAASVADEEPASSPLLARMVEAKDAPHSRRFRLSHPAVLAELRAKLGDQCNERLTLIYLDKNGRYLTDETLALGTRDVLRGRYRRLIQRAFETGAATMIVAHNHPSGVARPSDRDVTFTRALRALTRALDLSLEDHIVVTRDAVFSIKRGRVL